MTEEMRSIPSQPWYSEALKNPNSPLFVVDTAQIPLFFKSFNDTIGNKPGHDVRHIFHVKAGLTGIVKYLPNDVLVASSAAKLCEALRINEQKGKTRHDILHIGRPNVGDCNYITTPEPEELRTMLDQLGDDKDRLLPQVREIIFDGKYPDSYKDKGGFIQYFKDIVSLFPNIEKIHCRVAQEDTGIDVIGERHGAHAPLTLDIIKKIQSQKPRYEFCLNLYLGNPLTDEMIGKIADFYGISEVRSGMPFHYLNTKQQQAIMEAPRRMAVGGFAGVGEKLPTSRLPVLINQVSIASRGFDIEHGTDLVERAMSVIFQGNLDNDAIKKRIPDANNSGTNIISEQIDIKGKKFTSVYSPISYLAEQYTESNTPFKVIYL